MIRNVIKVRLCLPFASVPFSVSNFCHERKYLIRGTQLGPDGRMVKAVDPRSIHRKVVQLKVLLVLNDSRWWIAQIFPILEFDKLKLLISMRNAKLSS